MVMLEEIEAAAKALCCPYAEGCLRHDDCWALAQKPLARARLALEAAELVRVGLRHGRDEYHDWTHSLIREDRPPADVDADSRSVARVIHGDEENTDESLQGLRPLPDSTG